MNHSLIPTAKSWQLSFSHLRIKVQVYTRSLVHAGIISTLLYNAPKSSGECLPQDLTLWRMWLLLLFRCPLRTNRMGNSAKTKLSWGGRERERDGKNSWSIVSAAAQHHTENEAWANEWRTDGRRETHVKDAVEDRLEDDYVTVARSLGKLLLLLHVFLSVVDILVVLLRHPVHGLIYLINRNVHCFMHVYKQPYIYI